MVKIVSPWLTLVASFLETPHLQISGHNSSVIVWVCIMAVGGCGTFKCTEKLGAVEGGWPIRLKLSLSSIHKCTPSPHVSS